MIAAPRSVPWVTTTFGSTIIGSFVYSLLGLVLFVYGSFPSRLDGFGFQPVWEAAIGNANSIAYVTDTDGVGIVGPRSKLPKPFLPMQCGVKLRFTENKYRVRRRAKTLLDSRRSWGDIKPRSVPVAITYPRHPAQES